MYVDSSLKCIYFVFCINKINLHIGRTVWKNIPLLTTEKQVLLYNKHYNRWLYLKAPSHKGLDFLFSYGNQNQINVSPKTILCCWTDSIWGRVIDHMLALMKLIRPLVDPSWLETGSFPFSSGWITLANCLPSSTLQLQRI